MTRSYGYGSCALKAVVFGMPFFLLLMTVGSLVAILVGTAPYVGDVLQMWAIFGAIIVGTLAWGVPLNLYFWNHRIETDDHAIRMIDIFGHPKREFAFNEIEGWTHQVSHGETYRFVIEVWRSTESIGWTHRINGYEELCSFVSGKIGADVREPCPRPISPRVLAASRSLWRR